MLFLSFFPCCFCLGETVFVFRLMELFCNLSHVCWQRFHILTLNPTTDNTADNKHSLGLPTDREINKKHCQNILFRCIHYWVVPENVRNNRFNAE